MWPTKKGHLLGLINGCLKERIFPECWKTAQVVVLLKGKNKDPIMPKSYRPVSYLPVLGKIYEEVICNLLEANIGPRLSPNQHGFRPLKSTTTALNEVQDWIQESDKYVLVSFLDISGAFDNERWPKLTEDMETLECDPVITKLAINYLSNRTATHSVGSVTRTIKLTRGCPQGSKFGPRLWVITMDPLLKAMNIDGTRIVAYADDIALLVTGNTRKTIISKTEEALEKISTWAADRGLTFSKEKSVMVPLKRGLMPGFTARFGDHKIKSVSSTMYLGLRVSMDFSFMEHAMSLMDSSSDMFSRQKGVRRSK